MLVLTLFNVHVRRYKTIKTKFLFMDINGNINDDDGDYALLHNSIFS